MRTGLASQPPEEALAAAVLALLEQDPRTLDAAAALRRAQALQGLREQFEAAALDSLADLDERNLWALDGAGSAFGWLRQQVGGDRGQLALARRLPGRPAVRAAMADGLISAGSARSVCTSLDQLEALESGLDATPIPEHQLIGVLVHALPQLLRTWCGFELPAEAPAAEQMAIQVPDQVSPGALRDARVRQAAGWRRELLAETLTAAAEAEGQPAAVRLEPVFTLLARALSPHQLADALATILHALQPETLEEEEERFDDELHVSLRKRHGERGWELRGVLDDETGARLHADLQARIDLLKRPSQDTTETAETDRPENLAPLPPTGDRDSAPVEGPPGQQMDAWALSHAAFAMLLDDALGVQPGSGRPPEAHLTVIGSAEAFTATPGAAPARTSGPHPRDLSTYTLERMRCDSLLSAVLLDAAGRPLAASGTHRSFTRRERDALTAQWAGRCAVNGCALPGTIPHHVQMYARTGRTRIRDGIPLCQCHHNDIHLGRRTLRLKDGRHVNEDGWIEPELPATG